QTTQAINTYPRNRCWIILPGLSKAFSRATTFLSLTPTLPSGSKAYYLPARSIRIAPGLFNLRTLRRKITLSCSAALYRIPGLLFFKTGSISTSNTTEQQQRTQENESLAVQREAGAARRGCLQPTRRTRRN